MYKTIILAFFMVVFSLSLACASKSGVIDKKIEELQSNYEYFKKGMGEKNPILDKYLFQINDLNKLKKLYKDLSDDELLTREIYKIHHKYCNDESGLYEDED